MFAFLCGTPSRRICSAPVTRSASSRCSSLPDERHRSFASEKKCLLELCRAGTRPEPPWTITARAALPVLQYVPEPEASCTCGIRRLESGCMLRAEPAGRRDCTRYFHAETSTRCRRSRRREQARYREIARGRWRTRWPSTCAPMSRSAPSCPGVSTRPRSRRSPAAQPEPAHLHHRLRARGLLRGRRRGRVSRRDRRASTSSRWSPATRSIATLPLIVWYLDDPVADPALVPLFFVAREARKHVKVVLSGEGADELFGGYTIYREPISLRAFDACPTSRRRGWGRLSTSIPDGIRGKDLLRRGSIGTRVSATTATRASSDARVHVGLAGCSTRERSYTDITAPVRRSAD